MAQQEIAWIVLVVVALIGAKVIYARRVRYMARVHRAAAVARLAVHWESEGQIQRAYRAYSAVCEGSFAIKRRDIPRCARDRVLPLYRTIVAAYDDTLRALDAYRERVGRYPERLEEVQADIPLESLAAFRGFQYERKSDSDLSIVTGLYSHVTFDRRRFRASARQEGAK